MGDFYEALHTEPNVRAHFLKFVGGVGAVTKVKGKGMTITYSGRRHRRHRVVGEPGRVPGARRRAGLPVDDDRRHEGLQRQDRRLQRTKALQLRLYESGALADLAVLEWCSLTLLFSADGSL
jgi:hypothetical protein